MKIVKTKFSGLKIIVSPKFSDERGEFRELFKKKILKENAEFKFTCFSKSKKNVLRGLHLQKPNAQGKYITVIKGKILDVAVDLRRQSRTYKKSFKIILSSKNCKSVYIPKGFAHGFCTLKDSTSVLYKVDNSYNKESESGIIWNDDTLNIKWPIDEEFIHLSDKDKELNSFEI